MPDITLCTNAGCGLKENCYRYQTEPTVGHQSFADFQPNYQVTDGWSCEYFREMAPKTEKNT